MRVGENTWGPRGVPVLTVRVLDVSLPSFTCCLLSLRKLGFHRQVEGGGKSCARPCRVKVLDDVMQPNISLLNGFHDHRCQTSFSWCYNAAGGKKRSFRPILIQLPPQGWFLPAGWEEMRITSAATLKHPPERTALRCHVSPKVHAWDDFQAQGHPWFCSSSGLRRERL